MKSALLLAAAVAYQFQYPYSLHTRYPEAGGGLFGSPMDMIKFFVQHAGGESKGYEEFRTLVDKDAETSYSPSKL